MHTLSTATLHLPPLNACLLPLYVTDETGIIGPLVTQAPCWFHFTPCLRKENRAWGGMNGNPSCSCGTLVLPYEVHDLTAFHGTGRPKPSLYLRSQNEKQADPILVLSEKWMDLASALVCLTNFSFILVSNKRLRPDFEYRWCCGIVGTPGRTQEKRSLFRGNGQHLRKVQLASQAQNPQHMPSAVEHAKGRTSVSHPEPLPSHFHLWKLPEAQTTRFRPPATIWPRAILYPHIVRIA